MPNPKSICWLVTWNWPPKNWKEYLLVGKNKQDLKIGDLSVKAPGSEEPVKVYIKRIIASREIAPETRMPHIHIIIEFNVPVARSQMYTYYIQTAKPKQMIYDFENISRTIDYLIKDNPNEENIFFWPDKDSWGEFNQIFK